MSTPVPETVETPLGGSCYHAGDDASAPRRGGHMDFVDLKNAEEFSPQHHVHKSLMATSLSDISIACWEPGQTSPIHRHPGADEIYHVISGSGLFNDGRTERRLGAGDTVIVSAGEVHQVKALTRMVLYRVQAGADRHPESLDAWPASR